MDVTDYDLKSPSKLVIALTLEHDFLAPSSIVFTLGHMV